MNPLEAMMTATILGSAMLTDTAAAPTSRRARWAGRILTGLAVLFLIFDLSFKLVVGPEAVEGTPELGWPAHHMLTLALIELACLVVYLVPRTAPLGAILWTGYLGGAIATHLRIDNPLLSHTLFPIYIAALIWGGLYLRDARVRALLSATPGR
jgi:hypothetical protein